MFTLFRLFGGGIKKLLRTASLSGNIPHHPQYTTQQSVQTPVEESSGPATWLNKQRVKLNTKLLGQQPSVMKEDKPTYREQFVPPDMSVLAYLLQKVRRDVTPISASRFTESCRKVVVRLLDVRFMSPYNKIAAIFAE